MPETPEQRLRKILLLAAAEPIENGVGPEGRDANEVAYFLGKFEPNLPVRAQTPDRKHTYKIVNLEEDDFNGLPVLGLVEVEDYNGDERTSVLRGETQEEVPRV